MVSSRVTTRVTAGKHECDDWPPIGSTSERRLPGMRLAAN